MTNNYQKINTKAIALFLSLGMMSSLAGCEIGNTGEGGEGGEGDAPTEKTTPQKDGSDSES